MFNVILFDRPLREGDDLSGEETEDGTRYLEDDTHELSKNIRVS